MTEPVRLESVHFDSVEQTQAWGARLGESLRAGDLVVLTGGLGAGKTTLTQGIAEGMRVRGPITSPTFVIARVHPSLVGGPALVHVDAYRLGGAAELDDIDLDEDLEEVVTVVEWGAGLAEQLADDHLELVLAGDGDRRTITLRPSGARFDVLVDRLTNDV
ncbi:tRNA (adenosine(37)-N6)-threonylcarbamoyltransferase complex ATPase subunit type 1 TsaE [Rudaeicoccus suwonensis]|uniref:tRNA threonylcarbamoyladenosine biosynthesis protein TsaE n=1 Tax=Rudaeicoccus suwonensis TaxID=657409 RepID=A0A561E8F2_9MICO|nr:tRNA (adenosine(37)-N6)-threonylcarbamoyltransferase complex ATPase subunit type 1 TsaE [Rudaeicoccus suwonensis]TWE11883.1 tRNA threonylcarbamoyladenosine biosynthesis protein TsaE [Rudaeicoccus suwonensis]